MGIQPHQLLTTDDKRVYTVIPSPGRRDNPDLANAWVIKEIESHAAVHARNEAVAGNGADGSIDPRPAGAPGTDLTHDTTQEATRG